MDADLANASQAPERCPSMLTPPRKSPVNPKHIIVQEQHEHVTKSQPSLRVAAQPMHPQSQHHHWDSHWHRSAAGAAAPDKVLQSRRLTCGHDEVLPGPPTQLRATQPRAAQQHRQGDPPDARKLQASTIILPRGLLLQPRQTPSRQEVPRCRLTPCRTRLWHWVLSKIGYWLGLPPPLRCPWRHRPMESSVEKPLQKAHHRCFCQRPTATGSERVNNLVCASAEAAAAVAKVQNCRPLASALPPGQCHHLPRRHISGLPAERARWARSMELVLGRMPTAVLQAVAAAPGRPGVHLEAAMGLGLAEGPLLHLHCCQEAMLGPEHARLSPAHQAAPVSPADSGVVQQMENSAGVLDGHEGVDPPTGSSSQAQMLVAAMLAGPRLQQPPHARRGRQNP
mmetsp:Transcript_12748/g.45146  ORF Transcript_12748/g.45146 Transcript_12748/m.45146 type:complete len:396 (-) Transcript_12748:103-1290(-)